MSVFVLVALLLVTLLPVGALAQETVRIGFTYDLRDDYLREGLLAEQMRRPRNDAVATERD